MGWLNEILHGIREEIDRARERGVGLETEDQKATRVNNEKRAQDKATAEAIRENKRLEAEYEKKLLLLEEATARRLFELQKLRQRNTLFGEDINFFSNSGELLSSIKPEQHYFKMR
jgi:hypothetical protein